MYESQPWDEVEIILRQQGLAPRMIAAMRQQYERLRTQQQQSIEQVKERQANEPSWSFARHMSMYVEQRVNAGQGEDDAIKEVLAQYAGILTEMRRLQRHLHCTPQEAATRWRQSHRTKHGSKSNLLPHPNALAQ